MVSRTVIGRGGTAPKSSRAPPPDLFPVTRNPGLNLRVMRTLGNKSPACLPQILGLKGTGLGPYLLPFGEAGLRILVDKSPVVGGGASNGRLNPCPLISLGAVSDCGGQKGALGQRLASFNILFPADRPVVAELAASPPGGVRPGGNFTLTCRAEAWPPAQISWRAPPGALNIGLSSNNSTLSVAGAVGSHGGEYECAATNAHGRHTRRITVRVAGKWQLRGGERGKGS